MLHSCFIGWGSSWKHREVPPRGLTNRHLYSTVVLKLLCGRFIPTSDWFYFTLCFRRRYNKFLPFSFSVSCGNKDGIRSLGCVAVMKHSTCYLHSVLPASSLSFCKGIKPLCTQKWYFWYLKNITTNNSRCESLGCVSIKVSKTEGREDSILPVEAKV